MEELTIYCAMPHRPGMDNIEHGEWGLDCGKEKYVHEKYGESVAGNSFTQKIKELLPENYSKMFNFPGEQGSQAVSLELQQEDFSKENWEKVLTLIRNQWPRTSNALSI